MGCRKVADTIYPAAGGALGFVRGKELMYLILNHLDRAKLHGIMDTPADNPYWPEAYQPFRLRTID
jgi:2,3-bisphosphoglycerate-independent phosphoglycerate mutase